MSQKIRFLINDKYLTEYNKYSPNDLVKIANDMKDDGILSVEFCTREDYESVYVSFAYERLETQEEAELRLKEEVRKNNERIKWSEERLKNLAKQLNYKIEKLP